MKIIDKKLIKRMNLYLDNSELVNKIENLSKLNKKSLSKTIKDLIQVGLYIVEKVNDLDPQFFLRELNSKILINKTSQEILEIKLEKIIKDVLLSINPEMPIKELEEFIRKEKQKLIEIDKEYEEKIKSGFDFKNIHF